MINGTQTSVCTRVAVFSLRMLLGVLLFALVGCGGGGGGGPTGNTVTVTGFVLDVASGGAMATAPTIQIGSRTTRADVNDGSFTLEAPTGETRVLVNTGASYGTFTFTIPALTADTDLGALWVGPQKVTVTGVVRNASTNNPVGGATVTFGGRTAVANASGVFTLTDVAYANNGAFGSIEGNITATGYFANRFTAEGFVPTAGVVNIGDVLVLPVGDDNPPPGPYNLWGRVNPAASAPGTVVTLSQNGTDLHQYTVGQGGRYFFWVPAGTYDLSFVNGNLHASTTVTLTSSSQVVQKDVTLS